MSRRTEPTPIGPWYLQESVYEKKLQRALRPDGAGGWLAGTDPWWECSVCALKFDVSEFFACIGCLAFYAHRERERWMRYELESADLKTTH